MVRLNREMCCAMWHAFQNNRQLRLAWNDYRGQLAMVTDVLRCGKGVRSDDEELEAELDDLGVRVCRSFATEEIKRLNKPSEADRMQCRHHRQQHIRALRRVLARIPAPPDN